MLAALRTSEVYDIIDVNTLYRLFCFFKLFPVVGKGLMHGHYTLYARCRYSVIYIAAASHVPRLYLYIEVKVKPGNEAT